MKSVHRSTTSGGLGVTELLGHKTSSDIKVSPHSPQHIKNSWHIVDQRDVNGLDARKEGKAAVRDNDGIRMAHPAAKRIDLRIQDNRLS
jgi:hypothetical protein